MLSSKLPGAKKFRRWVTAEVLPTIRKTDSYIKIMEKSTAPKIGEIVIPPGSKMS